MVHDSYSLDTLGEYTRASSWSLSMEGSNTGKDMSWSYRKVVVLRSDRNCGTPPPPSTMPYYRERGIGTIAFIFSCFAAAAASVVDPAVDVTTESARSVVTIVAGVREFCVALIDLQSVRKIGATSCVLSFETISNTGTSYRSYHGSTP